MATWNPLRSKQQRLCGSDMAWRPTLLLSANVPLIPAHQESGNITGANCSTYGQHSAHDFACGRGNFIPLQHGNAKRYRAIRLRFHYTTTVTPVPGWEHNSRFMTGPFPPFDGHPHGAHGERGRYVGRAPNPAKLSLRLRLCTELGGQCKLRQPPRWQHSLALKPALRWGKRCIRGSDRRRMLLFRGERSRHRSPGSR